MLFLVQGSIFLKGPIPLFPSVSTLGDILLCASRHVVYVTCTQVMVVYEPEAQSSITILLICLEVRTCVQSLEYFNHLVPNKRSIGDEIVGEWADIFRISSKNRSPTENRSSSDHLIIMCEVLASIIPVLGITYGSWRYQIIP